MKKVLAFFVFFMLGALQVLAGQSLPSQFSVPSARQLAAQASAKPLLTTTARAARSHAFLSGSNPVPNPVSFMSGTEISTNGLAQWSAVVADFNGDGNLDIAAPVQAGIGSYAISVALSNGNGTFQPGAIIANPHGVAGDQILFGDFSNVGKKDLIIVHATNPATFEVWVPSGDGKFTVPATAPSTIAPNFLVGGAVADVNGDGNLDLVFVDAHSPANVWTLLGNGNGTFQAPTSVALSAGPLSNVVFADFNGDGILDFAAITGTQNVVYLGQANGTYVAGTPLLNPDGLYDICNNSAGDLNGDGKPEIVSANCSVSGAAGTLTIYVNNGDGTFKTGVYYASGTETAANTSANISPLAVSIADVNGDGMNDIVASNHDGGDVTILLGNGDGTVNVPTVGYNTGGTPKTSAIVADFNGDGKADIIVPDYNFSFAYLQGYGDGTFRGAQDFYAPVPGGFSAGATSVAVGDFNGDGYPDVVVGNYGFNPPNGSGIGVTVFLSNPDGSLQPGINLGKGGSYEGVAVADFNGDGNLDIAALNESSGGIQIYLGNGKGSFSDGNFISSCCSNAFKIISGDFNGDGHPDLAVVNTGNSNISVMLNDGTGNFGAVATYATNGVGTGIAVGDVNGDGILDLVVPQSNQGVDVFLGNSNGTFQAAKTSTFAFNNLGNVALGDLNGDGKLDIAVTVADHTTPNEGLAIAQGKGDGTFITPVALFATTLQNTLLVPPTPGDVKMFDLNGDGKLDLVFSNSSYGTVGILYNTGTNPFAAGMFFDPVENAAGSGAANYTPNVIALADVNHDGATDVVVANYNYAGATVLLNATGSTNTLKVSANPVTIGASVTFTATVAANVRGVSAVPTGSVTFLDGSTTLGSGAVSNGVATFASSKLAVGTHSISAVYNGDANFHSRASAVLSEVVTATPDFSLSGTNTVTVTAGKSASYTVQINPSNGYSGTVNFSCPATLPSKVGCSFSSASVTPAGGAYAATTLILTTTAATTASLITPILPNSKPTDPMLLASLGGFGLFGLVFVSAGSKRNRRHMAILGVALLITMFALVGCGGSSNSSNNNGTTTPGTPVGQYTVTLTAAGTGTGAPTHTMNVTLNVQ